MLNQQVADNTAERVESAASEPVDQEIAIDAPLLIRGSHASYRNLTEAHLESFCEKYDARPLPSSRRLSSTLRYKTLTDDDDLSVFTPIVGWSISGAIADGIEAAHLFPGGPKNIEFQIYPNNIGIITLTLTAPVGFSSASRAQIEEMEKHSTSLMESLADRLGPELDKIDGTVLHHTWPRPGLLWSSRIFQVSRENLKTSLFTALQLHVPKTTEMADLHYFVGIGNNVLVKGGNLFLSEFIKGFNIGQVCFAVNDEWIRELRVIQEEALKVRSHKPIRKIEARLNALATRIGIFQAETHDVFRCLQGYRKLVLESQYHAWDMHSLQSAVTARSEITTRLVAAFISERSGRYQSSVEAGLILIGGMAVLQFLIEYWSYAEDHPASESDLGFIGLAQRMSLDGTSLVAIVLILLFAYMRLMARK